MIRESDLYPIRKPRDRPKARRTVPWVRQFEPAKRSLAHPVRHDKDPRLPLRILSF